MFSQVISIYRVPLTGVQSIAHFVVRPPVWRAFGGDGTEHRWRRARYQHQCGVPELHWTAGRPDSANLFATHHLYRWQSYGVGRSDCRLVCDRSVADHRHIQLSSGYTHRSMYYCIVQRTLQSFIIVLHCRIRSRSNQSGLVHRRQLVFYHQT